MWKPWIRPTERRFLFLPLLLLCVLLLSACGGEDPNGVQAIFILPDSEFTVDGRLGEPIELPVPEELDGYVFLGWKDESGRMVEEESVTLDEDAYFAAVYGVGLIRQQHPAYLFADADGLYQPEQLLSRGDAARMLYTLMGVKIKGSANFYDVSVKENYAEATASLLEQGVVTDRLFRPKAPITRGDLLLWLSHFAPPAKEEAVFADVDGDSPYYAACCAAAEQGWIPSGEHNKVRADKPITRLETARLMNTVLGREAHPEELDPDYSGLYDLPENQRDFTQMLEAVIEHEYETADGQERWTSARIPKPLIDGFTSGNREVDILLRDILDEQLTDGMTLEEQLRQLYLYVRDTYKYRRGNLYEMGDTSFVLEEAKKMLTDKRGNCYSFASVLCELYRAIGVDARVYSGYVFEDPHAWVEADIDGVTYIFDVEIEYARMYHPKPDKPHVNMFMRTYEDLRHWKYIRGE